MHWANRPEDDEEEEIPDGVYYDDEWPTVCCPWCRKEIAEDSVQCPKCGEYLSKEDAPGEPKTRFWILMMALALLCALAWALLG